MQNPAAVMFLATRSSTCRALPGRPAAARLRPWLVWWLVATLCVYSCSASVLRVLGPRHWHAAADVISPASGPVTASSALLDRTVQRVGHLLADIQALADAAHARAHTLGAAPHHHSHSAVLRHWHDPRDDSLRLPAGGEAPGPELADLKAAAAIGGATLLPVPSSHGAWQLPARANGSWPRAGTPAWRSALTAPPLDPPIAPPTRPLIEPRMG